MAMIYVSHAYGGKAENIENMKQIIHDLQINDLENCYVCPWLTFSHLKRGEIKNGDLMELCKDLLTVCDSVIVASGLSWEVKEEIKLAKRCHLEVKYLERD